MDKVSSTELRDPLTIPGRGLGWIVTAFFIVADMVGGGVVAMPVAFLHTGLHFGIGFMVVITVFFAYTAHLLGQNWVIMQSRWPIYRKHCRKPYSEMAMRSMGPKMKILATGIVYLTMYGTSVVYILLPAKIFQHFLISVFGINISFCYMLCVVTIAIMPLTYLKSPADFWLIIVIAMLCTMIAVFLIAVGISKDLPICLPEVELPDGTIVGAIISLGTFLFAFSGHQVFPTVQHDMYRPRHFTKSVILGFAMVTLLYMPLSVYGYMVYGSSMHSSVIDSVQTPWIRHIANLAIAVHCILTLIIMVNPLNQHAEHIAKAPHTFGIERVMIRSCMLGSMLFSALTVPNFGVFMNLVGSTTNPAVCVVLPSITNLYLNAMLVNEKTRQYERPTLNDVIKRTNRRKLYWNAFIIVVAVTAGLVSVYLSLQEVLTVNFTPPCYIRPLISESEHMAADFGDQVNCCGRNRNIFAFGNSTEICHHAV